MKKVSFLKLTIPFQWLHAIPKVSCLIAFCLGTLTFALTWRFLNYICVILRKETFLFANSVKLEHENEREFQMTS